MIISSIDASINSSGIFKFTLDENLEVIKREHLGFTDVKKNESDNVLYYNRKNFKDSTEKDLWMVSKIVDFVKDCEYVGLEDHAFAGTGAVFDIGAFVGLIKYKLYEAGKKIRLYPPTSVKKYFTLRGTADKFQMWEKWKSLNLPDLDYLGIVETSKGKPILSDLVDSFAVGDLLLVELKIRRGLLNLKDLKEEQITIFNKVLKKSSTNILDIEFLEKSK